MQKYSTIRQSPKIAPKEDGFPTPAELAALRAWYSGMSSRDSVDQYLADQRHAGQSARSQIGQIRKRLITFARQRRREDLATVFEHAESVRIQRGRTAIGAIEQLRTIAPPVPKITDEINIWLSQRSVRVLTAHGINTLADLTVRVPRRRRWCWWARPSRCVCRPPCSNPRCRPR